MYEHTRNDDDSPFRPRFSYLVVTGYRLPPPAYPVAPSAKPDRYDTRYNSAVVYVQRTFTTRFMSQAMSTLESLRHCRCPLPRTPLFLRPSVPPSLLLSFRSSSPPSRVRPSISSLLGVFHPTPTNWFFFLLVSAPLAVFSGGDY